MIYNGNIETLKIKMEKAEITKSVKIKLAPGARMPVKATKGSSGYDVFPNIDEPMWIEPGERKLIPTGVSFSLPLGVEVQVRSRSGWAFKHGVVVLNGIGTVDSDYRGDVGVLVINHGHKRVEIDKDTKVAQLVFCEVSYPDVIQVDELEETERGNGSFGSTGGVS